VTGVQTCALPISEQPGPDDDLGAVTVLSDPLRRSLYEYVAAQPREVGRDEAANAVGVSRPVAAFHLDRLAEAGLLEVSFRRLSGRSGPGAGRPAKLYRRSSRDHRVSLPPRDYELAARLFAQALEEPAADEARSRLSGVARRFGQSLGTAVRSTLGRRSSRTRELEAVEQALAAHGYEPYREGDDVRLRNCPFDALAAEHRDLVCGMNLALLDGVVGGLAAAGLEARFDPRPGQCCVAVGPAPEAARTPKSGGRPGRRPRRSPQP
jgi:predicted ArsR family transcriptional regulator